MWVGGRGCVYVSRDYIKVRTVFFSSFVYFELG